MAKWAVETATGLLLYGGGIDPEVTAGQSVADVGDEAVSPRLHRWTGSALRDATAQEVADYDSALATARATSDIDAMRAVKAAVVTALWGRLGRQPTLPEIANERARFISIYKAL